MDPTPSPGAGSLFEAENRVSSRSALPAGLRGPQASSKQAMGAESVRPGPPGDAAFAVEGMPLNPEVPASEPAPGMAPAAVTGPDQAHDRPSPWPARLALVIEVMVWIELGMILIFVPWKRAWTDNSFVLNYPQLREFLGMNFIRGAVTGIGLLDLWAGISRAVYYKDPGKA